MNRKPAVAGTFYPATYKELRIELENLFADALPRNLKNIRAIISPHAGYIFSGSVAATAFNQLEPDGCYKKIFIIGSSHRSSFAGASIYCDGNFEMPYGHVPVDIKFARSLCREFPSLFNSNPEHHLKEHSIEVQLPFIDFIIKPSYKIIPILLGDVTQQDCADIATALKPYYNKENLFIISSDFSHYPNYENAITVDKATMQAIVSNNPKELLKVMQENGRMGIQKLHTSLCGWSSVMVLLYLTEQDLFSSYHSLEYKNSGDNISYGDKKSVVGYWAIAVTKESNVLHSIARSSIKKAIIEENPLNLNEKDSANLRAWVLEELGVREIPDSFKQKCGVFVTLYKNGKLRGCVGYTQSENLLYEEVANAAVLAACYDNRFTKVTSKELEEIEIEISVLSPMRLIEDINEIEMGRHGIYIKKGERSGLFLPQVGAETQWSREDFLGHCARDKAGLGWDGWKDAQISIFTVTII